MHRQHERVTHFEEIVLESTSGRQPARISDISDGGCYIDTIVEVKVGDEVSFEIRRPDGTSERKTGVIAYHFAGMGFGVRYAQ